MPLELNINNELILFFPEFWDQYLSKRQKGAFLSEYKHRFHQSYDQFKYAKRNRDFSPLEQDFISAWFDNDFTEVIKNELIEAVKVEDE